MLQLLIPFVNLKIPSGSAKPFKKKKGGGGIFDFLFAVFLKYVPPLLARVSVGKPDGNFYYPDWSNNDVSREKSTANGRVVVCCVCYIQCKNFILAYMSTSYPKNACLCWFAGYSRVTWHKPIDWTMFSWFIYVFTYLKIHDSNIFISSYRGNTISSLPETSLKWNIQGCCKMLIHLIRRHSNINPTFSYMFK